jgi:hypothetical protein
MSTLMDTGTVTLLNAQGMQTVDAGTYVCTTDGFAFGVVNGAVSTDGTAYAWIEGSCGPVQAVASGGQLSYPPNGSSSSNVGAVAVGTSFLLPVPAGSPFTLSVTQSGNNAVTPLVSFVWIPLGSGTNSSD